jgi:L-alanine-DL-glutamate epimerase-like enolase superfamily enzyme
LGGEVELLHDVHERLPPIQAIGLAKELERYRLFFLEDPFAPEDVEYLRILRQQTWPNDEPGLGVDIDEGLAAKYPLPEEPLGGSWPPVRRLDGTVTRP